MLYALALIPMGLLADRADRPRLLAGGLAAWSLLTSAASRVRPFAAAFWLLKVSLKFSSNQPNQLISGLGGLDGMR